MYHASIFFQGMVTLSQKLHHLSNTSEPGFAMQVPVLWISIVTDFLVGAMGDKEHDQSGLGSWYALPLLALLFDFWGGLWPFDDLTFQDPSCCSLGYTAASPRVQCCLLLFYVNSAQGEIVVKDVRAHVNPLAALTSSPLFCDTDVDHILLIQLSVDSCHFAFLPSVCMTYSFSMCSCF